MKPIWWEFSWSDLLLSIRTPLFAFQFSFYSKDYCRLVYWYGISFCWRPTKNIKEGDLYFQKSIQLVSDYVEHH